MNISLFQIQLICSFLVGGGMIALLSFFAERASSRISGIILAIPTTSALGFFFLGWAVSAQAVAEAVPSTMIPLGLAIIFPVFYAYSAEFLKKISRRKTVQIPLSFLISIIPWLIVSIPIIYFRFSSITLGILGFAALSLMTHVFLSRKPYEKPIPLVYSSSQKIVRALFAGSFVTLIVAMGKIIDPLWGAVFSMFPVAISSSLMIFHWYYDPEALFPAFQKIAIGSLSIFVYFMTVMLSFPRLGFVWGTIVAYALSMIIWGLLVSTQAQKPSLIPG